MIYLIVFKIILLVAWYLIRSKLSARKHRRFERLGYIDYHLANLSANAAFERILAHPFAAQNIKGRYYRYDPKVKTFNFSEELRGTWQPTLLAYLNISHSLERQSINELITSRFKKEWYRIGIVNSHYNDDLTATMAFAIAKLSFALQLSLIFGFIDHATHKRIMALNAIRARDCFTSWQDYGHALVRGRLQYLENGLIDYIGNHINEEMVNQWLTQKNHPWRTISWPSIDGHSKRIRRIFG